MNRCLNVLQKKREKKVLRKMVDTARQLLDELMGRNRNLDPTTAKSKKVQWDDPEVSVKPYCKTEKKNE